MKIVKGLATAALAGALTFGAAAPAAAVPTNNAVGGAAGLIAAVLQVQDVTVTVVDIDDVNVAVENVLNNNQVLNDAFQNFLNNNDVDVNVEDVVDVAILNGGVVVFV